MNQEKKREVGMMFTTPRQFDDVARGLIPQMVNDNLNVIEIPDSEGQVIIRESTPEYDDRLGDSDIVMFPIKIKIGDKYYTFYICSR